MQGTECSSAIPSNEETVAISTGKHKFLQKNWQEIIQIEFYQWAFQPRASV
jgi:hypothetical protein